jgi:hypothetical protein
VGPVYRYVPDKPGDLHNGKLQVLQVLHADGSPITQATQTALQSPNQVALPHLRQHVRHTLGDDPRHRRRRCTVQREPGGEGARRHALQASRERQLPARVAFQGVLLRRDGRHERVEPGERLLRGGWASVFKLSRKDPSAESGELTLLYRGDQAHAGFDNSAFFSRDLISFVEDAGDTLHGQRNALDSGYLLDVNADYSNPAKVPLRWLAEGRDASATLDASATPSGFGKNDGDNEITGLYVSDGDPGKDGILGTKIPNPWQPEDHWRVFYTQQHGDNVTYEATRTAH